MALALLPARAVLGFGVPQPYQATGGVEPYTYSVVAGGVGGTINSSTGLYTAPQAIGTDTIMVTDSTLLTPLTATSTVTVGTPLELFCDVIQTEMGLANGRIWIFDQKINQPNDQGLFIVVSALSPKPFGNTLAFNSSGQSVQSVNMSLGLSLDVCSRNTEALYRKEEVILALNSVYSEQQQNLNSFRIFPISTSFVNLSQLDGSAIPYRYNIGVNIQYFYRKTTTTSFYSDFDPVEVTTEP